MLILSDTHSEMNSLMLWLDSNWFSEIQEEKYCIQLGDFGFIFSNAEDKSEEKILDYLNELLERKDKVLFTILGNHDCWPRYMAMPTCTNYGFKTWKLRDRIHAIQPGEIAELEGKTFLCIGGADSHDKEWRMQYEKVCNDPIWWKEETISEEDIENAKDNLEKKFFEVDYVLTHCPPESFIYKSNIYPNPTISNSESKLEDILAITDFKHWYCGHVHTNKTVETGGKLISSLGIEIMEKI